MAIALTAAQQEALAKRHIIRRVFIWCDADDLNGDPDPAGFWDDVGNVTLNSRLYYGSGSVIKMSAVSARADLTIPSLTLTLSGIALETEDLVRAHAISQAPIEIDIGLFDTADREILLPLIPYFRGYVDDVKINTPEDGGDSTIDIICESTSRALTIQRTDTRSAASCKERFPSDLFYDYTGVQREKPLYFGRKAP